MNSPGILRNSFRKIASKSLALREAVKSARKTTQPPAPSLEGELLRLELRIARRADRLWRKAGYCSGKDLIHWLQAEAEVLEGHFAVERTMGAMLPAEQ